MLRKKKISKAAEVRAKLRIHNLNTGQLVVNDDDDEYIPSSDYSEDSSDDEYINERIKNLDNSFLIWSSNAHSKLKKSYTGNSRVTKFKKYGPSGIFTKAAKSSQQITNFFHKSKNEIENERDDNELEDGRNNDEIEYGRDDYELEDKYDDDELGDDDELEDKDDDELEDKDDDELEDKDDDELEDKDDDELEDKDDDE